MNRDELKGRWRELRGQARKRWGELTDTDSDKIGGEFDELVGRIQQVYGVKRAEAERQVDEWLQSIKPERPEDSSSDAARGPQG